jgi:hypothetical protein
MRMKKFAIAFSMFLASIASAQVSFGDTFLLGKNYQKPIYGSLNGFESGATVKMSGGEIWPSTFQIGSGAAFKVLSYCIDIPHDVDIPGSFPTMTRDDTAAAYNTWNRTAKIINDAPYEGGLTLQKGAEITWLMEKYATIIDTHLPLNTNVGVINGISFEGTAVDATLALQAAIWKMVYGPDYTLAPFGVNSNTKALVDNYNAIINKGIGLAPVGDAYWFNLKGKQQAQVAITPGTYDHPDHPVPSPNTLIMVAGLSACLLIGKRMR